MRFSLLSALTLLWVLTACNLVRQPEKAAVSATTTTVYLVRHAEKDTTPGLTDPPLTPAGRQRALALRDSLASHNPVALFTTDTRRTRDTLVPLEAALQLTPMSYDAKDPARIAALIRREYAGKKVVVVGHSNTLLPLIEALGVTRPMREIADERYDYLFEVRLPAEGTGTIGVTRYGARR
jgi:broad specificity phosphatase PhoE